MTRARRPSGIDEAIVDGLLHVLNDARLVALNIALQQPHHGGSAGDQRDMGVIQRGGHVATE